MSSRRFPRSPEISPKPFDGGPNPFADENAQEIRYSENPLAAPSTGEVQPFKPTDFVQTQSDRSQRVMMLGLVGAAFIGVSMLIAVIVAIAARALSTELVFCFPTNLLGLALCIPAWILGSRDLRAMDAGVMDDSGRPRTRIGYLCGCLGTLLGVFPFLMVLIAVVAAIFQ
jgi:hypothetical protein